MAVIAVIGASADRNKFSNRCVRAYSRKGWTVYPINPRGTVIEGLTAYQSIRDVPAGVIDLVSVYVPSAIGIKVLEEVAQREVREVMLNPGADDPEVVAKAEELGLNVVTGCSLIALGVSPRESD